MKNLYTMQPPYRLRDELMNTHAFFIPNTHSGIKTAAFMETAASNDRDRLFKLAAKDGDLDKAYKKLKALKSDAADDDDFEYSDDSDLEESTGLAEDSSEVEDDEFKIEDEDEDEDE